MGQPVVPGVCSTAGFIPDVSKGLSFSAVKEDFPSQGLDIEMRVSGFKCD